MGLFGEGSFFHKWRLALWGRMCLSLSTYFRSMKPYDGRKMKTIYKRRYNTLNVVLCGTCHNKATVLRPCYGYGRGMGTGAALVWVGHARNTAMGMPGVQPQA